jgi:hypothetical protein
MQFSRKIIVLFIAAGSLMPGIQNASAMGMGCSPLNKPSGYTDNRFDRTRAVTHRDFRQSPRPAYRPPAPVGQTPARYRYERHAIPGHAYPVRHNPRAIHHTQPHQMRHTPSHRWEAHVHGGYGNPQWRPVQQFSPPGNAPGGMPMPGWGAGPVHAGGLDPRRHAARYPYPPMGRYLAQPYRIQPPYPGMPGPGARNQRYGQGSRDIPGRWQRQVYRPLPPPAYAWGQPGWYGGPPVYAYRGPAWQPPGAAWRPSAGRQFLARDVSWGPYYAMPHSGPGMRAGRPFGPMGARPWTGWERHTPKAARIEADTRRAPAPATPDSNQTAENRTKPQTVTHGVAPEADLKSSETPAAPVAEDDGDSPPAVVEPFDSPSPREPAGTGRTAGSAALDGVREESHPETTDHSLSTSGVAVAHQPSTGKRQTGAKGDRGRSADPGDGQENLARSDPTGPTETLRAPPYGDMPTGLFAPPIPTLAAGVNSFQNHGWETGAPPVLIRP